jgi:hypothetical protein
MDGWMDILYLVVFSIFLIVEWIPFFSGLNLYCCLKIMSLMLNKRQVVLDNYGIFSISKYHLLDLDEILEQVLGSINELIHWNIQFFIHSGKSSSKIITGMNISSYSSTQQYW